MIDDSITKSMQLLSEADKLAASLQELKVRKTIDRNIKMLQYGRIDYDTKRLLKRKDSWKDMTTL
jgi:hypothetical protein